MTLEELFQRLSYGPMKNLAIGGEGSGAIKEPDKPSIILYANDALLRLHTRFVLIERALVLKQVASISNYVIAPEYTYSASQGGNPPETTAYIQDTVEVPFQDDLIKILAVYNNSGCGIPLNDEEKCGSYFTPQNHILQIPRPTADELTNVVYQARHPKLSFNPADLTQVITVPPTLEEAMIAYISYLQYSGMNGQDNLARAAEFFNRYNAICTEAESRGIVNARDNHATTKVERRGFP